MSVVPEVSRHGKVGGGRNGVLGLMSGTAVHTALDWISTVDWNVDHCVGLEWGPPYLLAVLYKQQ